MSNCPEPDTSGDTTVITESCQLVEVLNGQSWALNDNSDLAVTDDIQISGSVTVISYFFASPFPQCTDCSEPVVFENEHGGAGITVEKLQPIFKQAYGAQTLTLSNTTLRFRKVVQDGHPEFGGIPTIVLLPAKDQACGSGQQRCASDQVCYDTDKDWLHEGLELHRNYWKSYCLSCENNLEEQCLCRSAPGISLSDGTACGFGCSADHCDEGRCESGACVLAE